MVPIGQPIASHKTIRHPDGAGPHDHRPCNHATNAYSTQNIWPSVGWARLNIPQLMTYGGLTRIVTIPQDRIWQPRDFSPLTILWGIDKGPETHSRGKRFLKKRKIASQKRNTSLANRCWFAVAAPLPDDSQVLKPRAAKATNSEWRCENVTVPQAKSRQRPDLLRLRLNDIMPRGSCLWAYLRRKPFWL